MEKIIMLYNFVQAIQDLVVEGYLIDDVYPTLDDARAFNPNMHSNMTCGYTKIIQYENEFYVYNK